MLVEVVEISICDTGFVPKRTSRAVVPFVVLGTCGDSIPPPPPGDCLLADWAHDPADPECDARLGQNASPTLRFRIKSSTALGGFQGRIVLDPRDLQIVDIKPVGQASGMQVAWDRLPEGAKFVVFSDYGALIPPCRPGTRQACDGTMLVVTAASITTSLPPPVTTVRMDGLLCSDSLGRAVPFCPTFAEISMIAHICNGGETCDANSDGNLDVRDLVLMARCVRDPVNCPASGIARYDCNRDSTVGVDDVLCCARRILRGHLPDSLPPIKMTDLGVAFEAPAATAAGIDLPLRVRGADGLGAASFTLRCPAGTQLLGVEVPGALSAWMHVEDASAGEVRLGLIALTPNTPPDLRVIIHLGIPGGPGAAGPVELTAADFADVSGRSVVPSEGVLGIGVGGAPRLELSAARPNPMSRETRFELSLAAAANVDLGIFDLSGRRVASLVHGHLDAGGHTIVWDGKRTDGSRAADGVYFYRASGAGDPVTRRLVLMRGH